MRKYKLVKQDNLKDCGVCSLASIIEYYDGFVPLEKLREMTKTNKEGTTAYHIIEASKKLGFNSYGIKCELEDIDMDKITLPAVAYTIINNSYRHFLVIYNINYKTKKITIADPASRIKTIKFDEFKKIYQNIIINLTPIKTIPKYEKTDIFTKNVLKTFKNNKKYFISILLITLIFILLNLTNLLLLKNIFNLKNTKILFLLLIIILFLKEITNYYKNKSIIKFNKKIDSELTKKVFSHIIKLPYKFYRNRTTSEVISRLNDLDKIETFLSNTFISLIISIMFIIPILTLLFIINKQLFLINIILTVIYILISLIIKNKIILYLENLKDSFDRINIYKYELISSFEMIKGLNLENHFIDMFNTKYNSFLNKINKYENMCNKENSLKNFIISSFNIITIFFGIIFVNNKIITIENLFIFIILLSYYIEYIKNIFDNTNIYNEVKLSFKRINDLYYVDKIDSCNEKIKKISIDKLTYSIDEINNILENISLKINNNNNKIILFGKSGVGKSTLLKMIKKYYQNNKVLINGKTKKNNNIIYVSQDEYLLTDTLLNNITLNRNIDMNLFNKIIKICRIDDIIKNKNMGYNMVLEENGFNISGGEKQRIVLARALLTNFDVLLLDEALSEVDSKLERNILKDILNEFKDKIIILVSHRLDNIDLFKTKLELNNKKLERRDSNV